MKLNVGQGLVVVGLAMGLAACGPKLQSVSEQGGSATSDPSRRETITVGVSLNERKAGFALAGVTNFNMSLTGCASGYTQNDITQANPNIDLYKFDQGCIVKLNSFVVNGFTYEPSASDGFFDWSEFDVATFESAANLTEKFTVKVTAQLGSVIGETDSVSYAFTQLVAGASEDIAKDTVSDSHTLSVNGIDAAAMDIVGVTMTGMAAGGAGEFTFTVECASGVTGTGTSTKCGDNLLTSLKYVLVKDDYASTLTHSQAAALFNSAGTDVATILPLGTSGAANGGFSANVTGPTQMHVNPNMLFVIQSGGANGSYKYFNVDVETLMWAP
jgi:hypothetical protein